MHEGNTDTSRGSSDTGESAQGRALPYIAHKTEDGEKVEPIIDHLNAVARLSATFAAEFSSEEWGRLAGMAHDIGKYSAEFQQRIWNNGPKVDHSTAGAYELMKRMQQLPILAYCVSGHHGGLPDGSGFSIKGSTLGDRLNKAAHCQIPDYHAFADEVDLEQLSNSLGVPGVRPVPSSNRNEFENQAFTIQFFTRMVFSGLVDADYLATESFMQGDRAFLKADSMQMLCDKLEAKLSAFYPPKNILGKIRNEVLDACKEAAECNPGFFSLTVPTGGGKTFASMRFALHHALCSGHQNHSMKRVIYAIPYTSIIEQNAAVFSDVFGNENVLEHHANFDFDDKRELGERLRLASENWEAPIVVTTNVQFFESLYASKTSRCRKLHNIANSVIVLDEAQMLPTKYLKPCLRVLVELVANYGCTVVLCTATQPALNGLLAEYGYDVREIVSNLNSLFHALERVRYCDAGILSNETLAERLRTEPQVLCIVNSRKQANDLLDVLIADEGIDESADKSACKNQPYYLTTTLHSVDRSRILNNVRDALANGKPCTLIATSLVEAGVDLDFPVVYREVAGIDSVVQAAGRCNREGDADCGYGITWVFRSEESYALPSELKQTSQIGEEVLLNLKPDAGGFVAVGALDTIESYFKKLLSYRSGNLDAKSILSCISDQAKIPVSIAGGHPVPSFPFATMAEKCKLIDEGSVAVIVAKDANPVDIRAVREGYANRATIRRLSRVSISVYEQVKKALWERGAIEQLDENRFILLDDSLYDPNRGLDLSALSSKELSFLGM